MTAFMTNNRRPMSSRVDVFEKATKSSFEQEVKDAGFSCSVVKQNKGQWNECREFFVNGVMVECAMKGSSPDWQTMVNQVRNMTKDG